MFGLNLLLFSTKITLSPKKNYIVLILFITIPFVYYYFLLIFMIFLCLFYFYFIFLPHFIFNQYRSRRASQDVSLMSRSFDNLSIPVRR